MAILLNLIGNLKKMADKDQTDRRADYPKFVESNSQPTFPDCFGNLEVVFPMGNMGLRETPDKCMYSCNHKTLCLRTAMRGLKGIEMKEELVERREKAGVIGFFERWSKKKALYKEKERVNIKEK